MNRVISKGTAFGNVVAPPSKSYAHRLLIANALSGGGCTVSGAGPSQDVQATQEVLRRLQHRTLSLTVLPCGESGSTLRMLIPAALAFGGHFRFEGSERLFQRGLGVYEKIFDEQGISCRKGSGFIEVEGKLRGGHFCVDASVSSQFVSGLLFALPLLECDSTIELSGKVESRPYIDMTLDVLKQFGITVKAGQQDCMFHIPGCQHYIPTDCAVEGDYSNAAFLYALNLLGGHVEVTGLNPQSLQGDRMYKAYFEQLSEGFANIDISDQIDLGPIMFAMAAALHGAEFTGTRRLAIKESDRISAMLKELSKFGATFAVSDNRVRIDARTLHAPSEPLDGHNDHRIVMALSVLLTRFGGVIEGSEAVSKSFPSFFECLEQLGIKIN